MIECPYLPTVQDEVSGEVIPNDKYAIWMQGAMALIEFYESNSAELQMKVKNIQAAGK